MTAAVKPEPLGQECALPSSRIPGFYKRSPADRFEAVAECSDLEPTDRMAYLAGSLSLDKADLMVENVIGTFALPSAVAVNLTVNGRDRLVPMVVEEPSVVAAVSNMARLARSGGGFTAEADPSVMIGQIQVQAVADLASTVARLTAALPSLANLAKTVHPRLAERGGGFRGFEVREVVYSEPGQPIEQMVVLHVLLDCCDAMGANMVNTLCETLAPAVEQATGHTVGLSILSNLADKRLTRARCRIPVHALRSGALSGEAVASAIVSAWRFAWADPYRATTHNKGVMNGIDAVALATGNDWRAIEAGAHAYAARDGQYRPLTRWSVEGADLVGTIELPAQFGTVGGPIRLHPTVRANLKMLGVTTAGELAEVAAAVGLAQNLGALRALATEGIQAGHMRMHARSVAATAGATTAEVPTVVARLVASGEVSVATAERVLAELRGG